MSLLEWAKSEIDIIKKDTKYDEYDIRCFESALKAFESLIDDGHSGYSIELTKACLNRLIDGKPLSPIEDTPDIWVESGIKKDGETLYQCRRLGTLFKTVDSDSNVTFEDIERYLFYDIESDTYFRSKVYEKLIESILDIPPITFPYMPVDEIRVEVDRFKCDNAKDSEGDYDTVKVFSASVPDGRRKKEIIVNRYFKFNKDFEFEEIDRNEYIKRILNSFEEIDKNEYFKRILRSMEKGEKHD